ncbi:MAG: Lytic transglycosylase, catalytic [Herbaspirillum sp.]|nr:Lytic transglycosylase, catalytic [Herbaspirillum sp.]
MKTTLIPRFLILMSCTCVLAGSRLACAQVYAGADSEGTLMLSSFRSDGVQELIVADPAPRTTNLRQLNAPQPARPIVPAALKALVDDAAKQHGLDPLLLHAVVRAESGYNQQAVSPRGASGLMQLMPDTARRFGVKNLFDPRENLKAGARYLSWLLKLFDGDLELALAGYNAGEQAVIRAGYRIPPYNETIHYVPKVLSYYRIKPL